MKEKLLCFASVAKERFVGAQVSNTSVMVAYYSLLSLFPLLILAGNLMPYMGLAPETVLPYVETILPDAVQPVMHPIVENLLTGGSGGILSLSLVGLLWSASKGISILQMGINQTYGISMQKSFVAKRVISVLTLLAIIALMFALMLVFSFGEAFLGWLEPFFDWVAPVHSLLRSIKWPVTLTVTVLVLLVLYMVAPETKVRLRDALPGALVATLGLLGLVRLFAIYVMFAASRLSSYGALSSFFVLMFWLNFSAMIILVGAVLNASLQEYRFGPIDERRNRIDAVLDTKLRRRLRAWVEKLRNKRQKKTAPGEDAGGE